MKILVTGTAGFIGFHIAVRLLERGDEVVGLDNINDYYDPRLKFGRLTATGIREREIAYGKYTASDSYPLYRFIKLDLEDREALDRLFAREKFDAVCHIAAQAGVRYSLENPYSYIESNITGFLNILECCRHYPVRHLVYASSSSVYGANAKMPFSEDDCTDDPVSLYAATKKSNELMACAYSGLYGIPSTGLRFFTVYGPWARPDMAPMLFADAICSGRPIKVFNNGDMMRDFTYVDDIVEGVVRVIDNPPGKENMHRIYNIGCSNPVKLMDFIDTLEKAFGKSARLEMLPMQAGDVPRTYADTSKLERETGYSPATSLKEGVDKFIGWYKSSLNPLKSDN